MIPIGSPPFPRFFRSIPTLLPCLFTPPGTIPNATWCPWNFFRTSGDISNSWNSFFKNLQTTTQFQDYKEPLAKPVRERQRKADTPVTSVVGYTSPVSHSFMPHC